MKTLTQIDSLKFQIEKLTISLDSIKSTQTLKEINYKIDEHLSIVKDVNDFYDSAWLKLLFTIGVLGVLVPFIIQYFQRQSNKEIFKKYAIDFETKMELLKDENRKDFENLTAIHNQEIAELKQVNETSTNELYGNTLFLQGRVRFTENNFRYAFIDFLKSANRYYKIDRIKNTNAALNFLRTTIKKFETKVEFAEVLKIHEINWDKFIAKFMTEEKMDDYIDQVNELKKAIDELK